MNTDPTVVDPGFGLIQILQWLIQDLGYTDSTVVHPRFGFIQILQWLIQDSGEYRFYSGGSKIWVHKDSTVVDPELGLI